MENPEETLQVLEEWAARRARTCGGGGTGALPRQLDEYLAHVARTGDPVFHWASVKPLIKEKLLSAVSEFHETAPGLDVPLAPNVDPFNYEAMRSLLLERLDSFASAPFTVQRLCELLTAPRKQYNRIDKFMRAVEKNVLVVSTREPNSARREEEPIERALNGSDGNSECGVDVDMEDASWRDLRHPAVDPLAGVSHRAEPGRVDISLALPTMTTAVTGHTSPPADDKMDDTPEIPETPKPSETAEHKAEINTNDGKSESTSMDVEVGKEAPKPIESTQTLTKEADDVSGPVDHQGSEEDGNSNPELSMPLPEPEPEPEPKPESVTSGEDSSSSNSSENTDGESERGGGDSASRSPERSGASEGESSSCEPPEHDGDSNPKSEHEPSESNKEDVQPVPVQPENYTVADIHTVSVSAAPPVAEDHTEPEQAPTTPAPVEVTPAQPEESTKAPTEEPMQTEVSEEPTPSLPS